jgi:hypothetical protein
MCRSPGCKIDNKEGRYCKGSSGLNEAELSSDF